MSDAVSSQMAGKSVLFLINQDLGGGVEYLGRVLSSDLEKRGATCRTCFIYPSSGIKAAAKVAHILHKVKTIAQQAPDVIITFQPTASAVAAIAGRLGGCKVRIVHQSNSPVKSHVVVRELDKLLGSIGAYSVTIANSRATVCEFADYPKNYRSRIKLIEHGIPPPVFKLDAAAIRAKFGIPADGPILLMAARLDPQKGHNIIVSALSKLTGARLVMAGSGPEKDNLIQLARENNVIDRLHFLGHVGRQDLTDLYHAASLFVFPSSWETFGLAAVEAAMAGLPVVAAGIPALREVLTHDGKTTARFVDSRMPTEWAAAISDCLNDKNLRQRCEAFASVIQDHYSEDRMMQGYTELYEELMPGSQP